MRKTFVYKCILTRASNALQKEELSTFNVHLFTFLIKVRKTSVLKKCIYQNLR